MQFTKWTLVAAALSFLALPASAQSGPGDPSRGRELAERLCAICHNVDASPGNIAKSDVSSFYSMANRPGQSQERLVGGIVFPHPEMPTISFTNRDLKDLVAYVMTLKATEPKKQ
jgi:mono/diheme cytochrome c family protein